MNDSHVEDGDLGYFLRGARFLQKAFQNYLEASSKLKALENLIVFYFSFSYCIVFFFYHSLENFFGL